jgi:anti-sigma B factor antagonist
MTLDAAEGALTVRTRRQGEAIVLEVFGELDLATADLVRATLEQIHAEPPARLVIDLHGLSFMDSTGLALFVAEAAQADASFELEFWPGPPAVQRLFEIAGVRDRLPFVVRPPA